MHFQFLIEDQSSEVLIREIMNRLIGSHVKYNSCDYKSFKGIGGFTKKTTAKETHTGKLLNDLAIYLRGFQRSLQGIEAVLIIVLDNDDNNPEHFKNELETLAHDNNITMDHVFCLAVEEAEAWLLGDKEAVLQAYPQSKLKVLNAYIQDSICGTWEVLADAVYKGGLAKIQKTKMPYMEIGKLKSEWAYNISKYMVFEHNLSPSFQYFLASVSKRISAI